jgi:hypothetical protein
MAVLETLARSAAAGLFLGLCACGDGQLEAVQIFQGACSGELRLAVLVQITDLEGMSIDSVTATRESEQKCYLETAQRLLARGEDAGEPEFWVYSCWEQQGEGSYLVRVKSGEREWMKSVDVPGDECHVTKSQELSFELK